MTLKSRPASFVGRTKELAALQKAWKARSSAFIPIYGRRRIGKTELILRFMGEKRSLYHVGQVAPPALQQREFMREAARALGEPLLAEQPVDGWKTCFELLEERWPRGEKILLVLDEFQWTAGESPELPSVIQQLWDQRWSRSGRVMLILCGSFVGFMEREVLGSKSPLFGRRTAQIHLRPFGYREAALFFPGWSLAEQARGYFLCGGVPLYLRAFDLDSSVETSIEQQLLDEISPLANEPEFLLREELRGIETYYAVLNAIASGNATPKTIARASGVPERNLHYNLEQLCQLGYVARRYPVTGGPLSAKSVRYILEDALLRFWFRFVFPNKSHISKVGPRAAFRELIRPELDAYFGSCFERLCREALPDIYLREQVTAAAEVGEYWDKSIQIDVVGLRRDGWTDLGECKWGPLAGTKPLISELDTRARAYPNKRGATIVHRFFVQKLRGRKPSVGRWHTLEDLYRS